MASVRRIASSSGWQRWHLTPAQPIPQLYGRPYDEMEPHSSRHKGSCLSASFEMVANYQDKKTASSKSATLGVTKKAYPNSAVKTYFWNQATIHHFVWASKKRLVQLATTEKNSQNQRGHGVGWIGIVASISGSAPSWASQFPLINSMQVQNYWKTVVDALEVDRLPIVCVNGMAIKTPTHDFDYGEIELPPGWNPNHDERLFYTPKKQVGLDERLDVRFKNRPPPGHERPTPNSTGTPGRAPISKIHPSNPEHPGHAMVISGYYIDSDEKRYVRLLDPSPSMGLRENPYRLHEPDPWALDPRNHVKWVSWDDLSRHIDRSAGLIVFRTENRPSRLKAGVNILDETLYVMSEHREDRSERFDL